MRNAPIDEPMPELNDDLEPEPGRQPSQDGGPSIVAGVGSSALGSADLEDDAEDSEPQEGRHPDNDGETVEG